jgi:hypothetical protein
MGGARLRCSAPIIGTRQRMPSRWHVDRDEPGEVHHRRAQEQLEQTATEVPHLGSILGSPETVALGDSGTSNFEAVQASGENVFEGLWGGLPIQRGQVFLSWSRVAGWRSTYSSERSAFFL